MHRRAFLASILPLAGAARGMKITRIDTIYWKSREAAPFWPHWVWVRVHSDSGHTGV
ncbi:MAG: mandelate racemase/muconate lactonizing enzyme family protein, partial [Acidobacteria bacterium]|nr:mandelate racemase/muconate lactonizing enzyme family protein [Acidobacteriota bacterium]